MQETSFETPNRRVGVPKRVVFEDRGVIYRQGDRCREALLIESGLVRLSRLHADGREVIVDIVGVGDVVGNLTASNEWTATEEARALGPVTGTVVHSPFGMESVPLEFVQALMRRTNKLKERLVSHLVESVEQRLARSLHDLALAFDVPCTHGFSLEVLLTQQDLADIVCASRPVVSLALNRMKECGLLNYTGQKICVHAHAVEAWAKALHGEPALLSR
jgi:CRP-like cAMP-binding protein